MPPNRLTQTEIESALSTLDGWSLAGGAIEKEYVLKDFAAALAFVNAVGAKAEEADHHPDILMHGWNKVRITLSTHSAGGLTELDIRLARVIDSLPR
ncbi:MAG: 4a-hydroxytetrahydrobiopterin dehydratase [Candidatus Sumerlaeaceae bacterium]|nr:4a-hydroxytetrahydrobiopterin dehydratase [Candidatus Sumerlaeaceae bacterium]